MRVHREIGRTQHNSSIGAQCKARTLRTCFTRHATESFPILWMPVKRVKVHSSSSDQLLQVLLASGTLTPLSSLQATMRPPHPFFRCRDKPINLKPDFIVCTQPKLRVLLAIQPPYKPRPSPTRYVLRTSLSFSPEPYNPEISQTM